MNNTTYPNVSIVVPVYNSAKYLDRFIKSILDQSYKSYEVIFVNDGSTDNSAEIINKYKSEAFVLVNKKNGGVSSARNEGLKYAKGEYICFFDSDDTIDNNTLEIVIGKMKNNDLLVYCYRDILKDGSVINHYQTEISTDGQGVISDIFFYASKMQIYSPCNKVYRKSIIDDNGLRFKTGLRIGEDYLFNLTYISVADKIEFTNDVLYNYYQNENSAINSYDPKMIDLQYRVISETYKFKKYESSFEKEFLVKRITYLYRYYKTKMVKTKSLHRSMIDFYQRIHTLNIENKSKVGILYEIPFKLLTRKKYKLLNWYISFVCEIIEIKRIIKGR